LIRSLVRRCLPVAVIFSLLIPSQVTAITWDPVRRITESGTAAAWAGGLSVSANDDIQVAYREFGADPNGVFMRRSTDSGTTWLDPAQVGPESATAPAVASSGSNVDLVYLQFGSDGKRRIKYRRSTNAGETWSSAVTLASLPADGLAAIPSVARDGAGRVAVVWTNTNNGRIYARVSSNGGASFRSTKQLATTTNTPWQGFPDVREGFPDVAIANGRIHVAFNTSAAVLKTRRTEDNGSSWTSALTLSSTSSGFMPTVAAARNVVLVGYANLTDDIWTVYRRSSDGGASWGSVTTLVGKSQAFGFQPIISVRSGVWRAAMERCTDNSCTGSMTLYRESSDGGRTWTAQSRVSPTSAPFAAPVGVSESGGKAVVAYLRYDTVGGPQDVHVRTGS
jgi:hypothetical protein